MPFVLSDTKMIQNRHELENAYATLAKMVDLRDRCAEEPLWSPSLRANVAEGIESQIRKIEREITAYLHQQEQIEEPVAV